MLACYRPHKHEMGGYTVYTLYIYIYEAYYIRVLSCDYGFLFALTVRQRPITFNNYVSIRATLFINSRPHNSTFPSSLCFSWGSCSFLYMYDPSSYHVYHVCILLICFIMHCHWRHIICLTSYSYKVNATIDP